MLDAYLGDGPAAARGQRGADPRRPTRFRNEPSQTAATAASVAVLELRDVRAAYGKIEVLHGIDLVVADRQGGRAARTERRGEEHDAQGRERPDAPSSGCVHVGGRHVNGAAGDALSRIGLCTIPEGRGVFPNLTVRENLVMATYAGVRLATDRGTSYTLFPRSSSVVPSWPERCRAASSGCWRWRGRS